MDFCEFDDELFEKPRDKVLRTYTNYTPKMCISQWFVEDAVLKEADEEECLVLQKHQADLLFFQNCYSEAAEAYRKCLDLVQADNLTLYRDCVEGLARCLISLKQFNEATLLAKKLFESSTNIDQKVVSNSLLGVLYQSTNKYSEELEVLQQCIQTHPWHVDFWLRLGLCYARLSSLEMQVETISESLQSNTKESFHSKQNSWKDMMQDQKHSELQNTSENSHTEPSFLNAENNLVKHYLSLRHKDASYVVDQQKASSSCQTLEDNLTFHPLYCSGSKSSTQCVPKASSRCKREYLFVYICLLRARFLLQGCMAGCHSFVLLKKKEQEKKINQLLRYLNVSRKFEDLATQVISREMFPHDLQVEPRKEQYFTNDLERTTESMKVQNQFEDQWFGWISDYQ
ncbi:uncharacterized protein C8orf76-like isoform X2 [Limulus polyphemus]|nr:uncharacterized protein C8orf76-like isoform X2 [Limulus polyphemus]